MNHKRVTLTDVASRAGFSTAAVSLVLNNRPNRLSDEAAQRIRAAAKELDYRPNPAARSLRVGKTATVAVISDEVTVTRYASAMLRGMLDVADDLQHTVLLAEVGHSQTRLKESLRVMLDRGVDGVILALMGAKQVDRPHLPTGLPMVLCNATSSEPLPFVLPAEYEAGYAMTKVLLDAGHRNIAVMGLDDRLREPRVSVTIGSRYDGILAALQEADTEPVATTQGMQWEPQLGYESMANLLGRDVEFSAVLTLNDRLAFGALQLLQERGISVPGDISIASFDDDEIATYLHPALTTAAIPYEEMGRQAMSMTLAGVEGQAGRFVEMPIRVRDSVARL